MKPSRRLLYSLVPAVLLLGGLELGLRIADYQGPADEDLQVTEGMFDGAWVQRRDRHLGAAFEDIGQGWVQTGAVHRQRGMHNQRFPASSQGELRLWALGGSTTVGLPFENRERGFPGRLEKHLQDQAPERLWRVVNAGVPGMDSRGFAALTREGIDLGAHGLVIYAGNNEIRGTLIEECTDPLRTSLERDLNQLYLVRLGRALYRRLQPPRVADLQAMAADQRTCMRRAIDAARSSLEGLPGDHRTDALYQRTVDAFADSLDQVVGLTEDAGIPVWIAVPPVHLRHPPTLGLPHPSLTDAQRRQLDQALSRARSAEAAAQAVEILEPALSLDPSHAELRYLLGMALLELEGPTEALPHLQAAVDLDWQGDRVTSELQQVVRDLCREHPVAVRCVDLDAAFRAEAPQGIPGDTLFVDFCHPTWELGVDAITRGFAQPVLAWSRGG